MSKSIPLHWKGQLVGYIADVNGDNFHTYGKWVSANSPLSPQFVAVVEEAMSTWEETGAGVDVYLDANATKVVEVTHFENGEIGTLWNPGRWT
jgi:hypothetical protein